LHNKDATGAEIERSLLDAVLSNPRISLRPNQLVVDLILRDHMADQRDIVGVWCLDLDNETMNTLGADAIILATGGAGQLYQHTTNPSVATADGTAMAIRAGAKTKDMAFIQFHPTALAILGDRPFLITEALRGDGAVLLSKSEYSEWKLQGGDIAELSFTNQYSHLGSLATRDIVARAIDQNLKRSGDDYVYLVTEHLQESELQQRFPTISARLERHGLRLGRDPLPVAPAAHYFVGGLDVDVDGRVKQDNSNRTMAGLYAIGEVACSGMHGANRLASNSLLEAVVFAYRATDWITNNPPDLERMVKEETLPAWRCEDLANLVEHSPLKQDIAALQATMTHDVGLVKSNARLQRATRRLELLSEEADRIWRKCRPTRSLVELRNMVLVAQHVCSSSISMEENIGLHFNHDLA
jgi:L-aspartate oxidase